MSKKLILDTYFIWGWVESQKLKMLIEHDKYTSVEIERKLKLSILILYTEDGILSWPRSL